MTKLEQKMVELLANYPEREFYGQEIAEKIKCSKASASNILTGLFEKKIALKNVRGHMKFYQINLENPEVKKFKINFVLEALNSLLPKLEKMAQKIILFGSGSRGEQTFNSDIDLFIISNDKAQLKLILSRLKTNLPIKAIIKTSSEWSEMEVTEPEFFQEVKNGIILYEYVSRI
jgi:predicted nucleotidyltransferase